MKPIILGGGLAGLSACYHGDGVVYEKDQTFGPWVEEIKMLLRLRLRTQLTMT